MSQKVHDMPDHMSIVCHSEGCAEVKARLATIQEKQKVAQQKLDECSRNRKQLAQDLAAAAAKRGKAEKALRQCAEVDRPNAEKALAKCAKERAQLEAELKQCAEIDRPNAEKEKAGGGGGAAGGEPPAKKKSSRRRRRRNT